MVQVSYDVGIEKGCVICPFVVHEHVLETTMTRVSSCMYVMGSVSDVVLKYMMLGSNTDRVPAEYRQSTGRSEKPFI